MMRIEVFLLVAATLVAIGIHGALSETSWWMVTVGVGVMCFGAILLAGGIQGVGPAQPRPDAPLGAVRRSVAPPPVPGAAGAGRAPRFVLEAPATAWTEALPGSTHGPKPICRMPERAGKALAPTPVAARSRRTP